MRAGTAVADRSRSREASGSSELDEGVEPGAGAAVGKGDDRRVAHRRVALQPGRQRRRVVDEAKPAALAVGDLQHAARNPIVDALASRHPDARRPALACEHAPFGSGQAPGHVAALVLEQMSQVFVGEKPERKTPAMKAGGELEIREHGATVRSSQPVLFLGEVIMSDVGPVQRAQRPAGGSEKPKVVGRLLDMDRKAVDPAANQAAASGEQQRRRNAETAGNRERARFPRQEVQCERERPPGRHVDPAQHRGDFASLRSEIAALDGAEDVALEHELAAKAARDLGGKRGSGIHRVAI